MPPCIAFFDMDHTLMDNDCDVSWKKFLIAEGLADPSEDEETDRHFQDYLNGTFNTEAFLAFQLRQFQGRTQAEMAPIIERHFDRMALPRIYPQAEAAVREFQAAGAPTFMLTATNEAIAAPIARHFRFAGVLATRLELHDGLYTGRIIPPYCFGEEKINHAGRICSARGLTLAQAAYYGDSRADIPMLEAVGFPIAVNPHAALRDIAVERGWDIETWRLP
ncbi:MAG: HAD-IB family hydrolase [Candidatus Sumerlaeota bacterium]|nr:HAD-IB family hydrolase [Candidatus Sumerlaeota bacterium]